MITNVGCCQFEYKAWVFSLAPTARRKFLSFNAGDIMRLTVIAVMRHGVDSRFRHNVSGFVFGHKSSRGSIFLLNPIGYLAASSCGRSRRSRPTRYRRASAHGFQLYRVFSTRPCLNFAEMPSDRLPLLHPQFAPRLALATEQNRLQEEVLSEARSIGFHRVIDNPVRLRSANSLR